MQLSQSVTYALQALIQLAESGQGVLITRGKLAANGRMPERFLLEILHDLVKRGILRSTRGGGGGFALARSPEAISLLDVIEAIDGPLPAGMPAGNSMPQSLCDWLQMNLEQVRDSARTLLSDITLDRLLQTGLSRNCESLDCLEGVSTEAFVATISSDWPISVEQESGA